MAKVRVEICIISARGLARKSSLWKPQWFAVGWIERCKKYCSKVDRSGSLNPTWKTKFSSLVDDTSSNFQGLSLTIEVYRRVPIFSREKLEGTATVMLKEFFTNFGAEETASFQLRKGKSGKPRGFVDVSVCVFEENDSVYSHSGFVEGLHYSNSKSHHSFAIGDGISYPKQPQSPISNQFEFENYTYNHSSNHNTSNQRESSGEGYDRPSTPPPPPPPSNIGFLPTLFPGTIPRPRPSGQVEPGAGALAAGAVIFGDDFLSGPSFHSELTRF